MIMWFIESYLMKLILERSSQIKQKEIFVEEDQDQNHFEECQKMNGS
ncbi:Uncharacterised protein [Mycobacterium tuberculosis]|nr:Uncharacterised protein [Mycobacterium tuberculosis]